MSELELIAKSLFDKSVTRLEKIDPSTFKIIENIGRQEYLFIIFKDYPQTYVDIHLMANQELWKDLENESWKIMINKLQDLEISLYTLISFLHKYARIDAITAYKGMNDMNNKVRDNVISYFKERPGLLRMHDHERVYFSKNNINIHS